MFPLISCVVITIIDMIYEKISLEIKQNTIDLTLPIIKILVNVKKETILTNLT